MLAFLAWWLIIQLFSLAALPLARRVFAWLPDRGYAFSKTSGLLLVSFLLWLGASAGALVNNAGGITLALLLVAGLSAAAALWRARGGLREQLAGFWKENKAQILVVELLFLAAFAGWALVRAFAPDKILPQGGEKYMEIAFLNGVLNSPRFPPLDPWMSGYAISYYYFGYVMMGVIIRLSGVAPTVGFDLYDALLFGLTAVTAYGVVYNLVRSARGSDPSAQAFGLLGALFVGGLGNLEGLLEGLYSAKIFSLDFWRWLDIPDLVGTFRSGSFYPGSGWWWWRASRVLHDLDLFYQPAPYQPIDEFPFFSFLLGDNHPHKLALPFVLLAIGLAFNLLLRQLAQAGSPQPVLPGLRGWLASAWLRRGEAGFYLFYAVALGGLAFLNTWDFPIYLGLVVLAYAAGSHCRQAAPGETLQKGRLSWLNLPGRALLFGATLGAASIGLYFFFYLGFASQAGGVLPYVFPPTRLAQYLVMFGTFIGILAFFILLAARRASGGHFPIRQALKNWLWIFGASYGLYLAALLLGYGMLSLTGLKTNALVQSALGGLSPGQGLLRILAGRVADPWLFLALSALLTAALAAGPRFLRGDGGAEPSGGAERSPATFFGLLLAFAGIGLTLAVEFFYLRDSFGIRMNSVFKFYFQGWVLMACASAFGAWWVRAHAGRAARRVFTIAALALVGGGLAYSLMAVASRAEGFSQPPNLDAAASFSGFYPGHWAAQPDDWAAIQWLRQNGRLPDGSAPVILEAGSGGYENAGRIAAFTGFPSLLGWTNHEGQWRGSQVEINRRAPVIQEIYTNPNASVALELLRQWKVRYVIVGQAERDYVARLCQDPGHLCDPNRSLGKFNQALIPVFDQGRTRVYQVPDVVLP